MLKIYFHTLVCICWFLLPYLIAQCTVMDHMKSRLVTLNDQVTGVGYAVVQHSGCAEICVRNPTAEIYFFSGLFRWFEFCWNYLFFKYTLYVRIV
jgi:hypothetical protein